MKRLLLLFMAVMAFAGLSVAQDIYSAGYYTNSYGTHNAAVYKNGTKLYGLGNSENYDFESNAVLYLDGNVYWTKNVTRPSDGAYLYADIYKNGSLWLNSPTSQGYHINDIAQYNGLVLSTGCANVNDISTAVIWSNNNATPQWQLGNGTYRSEGRAICVCSGTTYVAGIQYTSSDGYNGVVWRGTAQQYNLGASVQPRGIAYYDGDVYTVANCWDSSSSKWIAKVFKNSSVLYTLTSTSTEGRGFSIDIDAGDIFVSGWLGSKLVVWKNGSNWDLFDGSGSFTSRAVAANQNGVYHVGQSGGQGRIWKDATLLYSPSNCDCLYDIYMDEPTCDDGTVRTLPFFEGFENNETEWACWTKIDIDNQNGSRVSYWDRCGTRIKTPATGNYCARHTYHSSNNQTGWLISPRIFLQPERDNTVLTFKTYEGAPEDYTSECVLISTNSDPTNTSAYQQVWTQTTASDSWKTVSVNLSDYQGEAIYIAFKYTGTNGHLWYIDDVSVNEYWTPCSLHNAPYSQVFSSGFSSCWYVVDNDHSGGQKCWKYNESEQCVYHPWGQQNVPQEGWLFSPRIVLTAGHDYALTFDQKNNSSGSNMHNSVWIAVDKTGEPDPSDYQKIWEAPNYPTSWSEVSIPLTSYAGHNINIAFKYEGTYAHNWYIDNVHVAEAIAQYTITANANNNAWGTVTGGGTYNAGTTCTLSATPASGYQFQSWKKNGTIVSTNPNYSFTVTENATYTAYFGEIPINYYTITTVANPSNGGTVSGGGTYQENSSVTLTATANTGYSFDHWNDGNTQNPRTITVTGDATYTAYFTQNDYTITVSASPSYGGSVTGGGTYHYGETATLTATPASGYEFAGWSDANTQNPRTVTVTGNANYTAIFSEVGATYYNVSTQANPDYAGYVTGGGTYEEGSSIVLTAVAYSGYSFTQWNDGVTQNPRPVTVTGNMSFTANFEAISYTISVTANPSNAGTVSGGGVYYYNDVAMLYAEAYSGYEFVGWSDGSSENPHYVTVTGNASYTATFSQVGTTYYTVSAYVSPFDAGYVDGTGTYPEGTSVTLTAVANTGYVFNQWNDGVTANPRTVTVNNNMSFTAYFNTQQYTVTVNATPADGGTVTGGGTYSYGQTAVLTATPNANYTFLSWGDGVVDNPRYVTVTGNATYNALFMTEGGQTFTLTVEPNSPFLGQTYGSGVYPEGSAVEISAFPTPYSTFVQWNDGNTDNPRTVIVNGDATYIAEFVSVQYYDITVVSADPTMGEAYGGGNYLEGTVIEISALPFTGYQFTQWSDGNTDNPRSVTVTGDATYTAQFALNSVVTYTLTLICNTDEGTVSGGGVYVEGSTATIQAFPKDGYVFDFWNDGNTENPRTVSMNSDLTLVAFFRWTSVDEFGQPNLNIYPNPANDSFRIQGLENTSEVQIFNSLGELVKTVTVNGEEEIGIQDLASGVYVVRCGDRAMRFVKM